MQEESLKKMTNEVFTKFQEELQHQFSCLKEERELEFRRITTQFQYMNDFMSRAEINLEKGEDFEIYKQKSERELRQLTSDLENSKNESLKLKKELQESLVQNKERDDQIKSLEDKIQLLLKENEIQNQNLIKKETELETLKIQKKEITQSFKKLINESNTKPNLIQSTEVDKKTKFFEKKGEEDTNPLLKSILERSLKNDPNLKEIVLQNSKLNDKDVSKIAISLLGNTYVRLLDLSSNLMTGNCMDDIETLLLNTKSLEELMLDECPIETKRIKQLLVVLQKNRTLTQVIDIKNKFLTIF